MTDYTDSRQLGLFFEEDGFAARWFAEDVSDGTIMSVALFFSLLDRRHRIVMIEEPETSLHPWILRKFLERCRELSVKRQIIITTHSPLAVAFAKPSELFLIDRKEGATSLTRAEDLEANLSEIIRADLINLGEYWLSGGLGAVPTVPDVGDDELFG
jgi:predicted ATPase